MLYLSDPPGVIDELGGISLRTRFPTLGRAALLIAALLVTSAAAGVESASAAWSKVAVWNMNEPPGANKMTDSSGNGRSGTIGNLVTTGVVDGSFTGYQFTAGGTKGDPGHLVIVNRPPLNPYRSVFKVALRVKTTATDQNIVQKGQANTAGGHWKIETDVDGHVVCTFRGAAGRGAIRSGGNLADGNWHKIVCIRRPTRVLIIVGNGFPRVEPGPTGRIANEAALTIGGKKSCTAPNVSCQYYDGLVDRVAVYKSRS
jgi:hypothetical protein